MSIRMLNVARKLDIISHAYINIVSIDVMCLWAGAQHTTVLLTNITTYISCILDDDDDNNESIAVATQTQMLKRITVIIS